MPRDQFASSGTSARLDARVYVVDDRAADSSSTPWFWSHSAQKVTRRGIDAVDMCQRQRHFIQNVYSRNTDFSNAIRLFLARCLKNGLEVKVSVLGKTYEFSRENEETRDYFVDVVRPNVEQVLLDFMLYGMARVRLLAPEDAHYGGLPRFILMPDGTTTEYMHWDENDERHYGMVYSSSSPKHKQGAPVPGGYLMVLNPPLDSGWLQSKAAMALTPLAFSDRLWLYYIQASSGASRPPYVFSPEGSNNSAALERDTTVTVTSGMAEVIGTDAARQHSSRVLTATELHKGQQALAEAQKAGASDVRMTIQHQYDEFSGRRGMGDGESPLSGVENTIIQAENNTPWQNQFVAAPGHRLQTGPRPHAPEAFLDVLREVTYKLYRALGVPPELMSSTADKHAANVALIEQELLENVQKFQTDAAAHLHKMFSVMFEGMIDRAIFTRAMEEGKATDAAYMAASKRQSKVEVRFRDNPTVSHELLASLYDRGLISKEVEQKYALGAVGIPMQDAVPNPEEELLRRAKQRIELESSARGASAVPAPASQKRKAITAAAPSSKKPKP